VSFASPLWLLSLLVVPLALAGYVTNRARARRYAVRFPAVPALRAAAGTVPAWQRHLPAALALAAATALALALARPQATVAVPVEQASIMLVTDHSRSMEANDVQPSRLSAAQKAARSFLGELPAKALVGVVAYSDVPDAVQAPTTDHDAARRIVDGQIADGATATGDALQIAIDALSQVRKGARRPPSAIVLLSDGKTTAGRDPVQVAREAGRLHIPVYTVALGTMSGTVPGPYGFPTSVEPDPETLRTIAQVSGGRAFTAEDDSALTSIYKRLGSRLGSKRSCCWRPPGHRCGGPGACPEPPRPTRFREALGALLWFSDDRLRSPSRLRGCLAVMERSLKRKLAVGAAGIAVVASAGGAYAAGQSSAGDDRQAVLNDVAKRLNVTPSQLQDAVKGALSDRLDAAVAAGRLTQAQADQLKQRLQRNGALPFFGSRRGGRFFGGGGSFFGPGGGGFFGAGARGEALDAAATYLGLAADALRTELRGGKSLAQVAKDHGKSVDGLEQAIEGAVKNKLDADVKAQRLTAAQEQQILSRLHSRIGDLVNGTHPHGGGWRPHP
jgi:Ca-activated chloride channel homolog